MNQFFSELMPVIQQCKTFLISITVNSDGSRLNVITTPVLNHSDASTVVTPMQLVGTPEELDAEFITAIQGQTPEFASINEMLIQNKENLEKLKTKIASKNKSKPVSAPKQASEDDDDDEDSDSDDENQSENENPPKASPASRDQETMIDLF
ncbi:PRTRC system protein E [Undibacterium oligocarboniphilum]|uniref:PRTRC system protein E n=1 Tax=Undibacterium oligocarboniphilum TaxID=666702 RepID=A0A850QP13_9BURK|nr:PRTRC system protein E [Undibacterium oligocarboniphilum]MBC3871779.1 PRTRC system protein E [Undibacterium oligocarboniphilum]NVO79415.1 PRTRC system protein E [Undibacterium oligocarboniphilum]